MHLIHTPRFSGAETLVAALTKLHADSGHQSEVVAFSPAEPDFVSVIESQKNIGIPWLFPKKSLGTISRIRYFRQQFLNFRPDVVFAHSVLPAAYGRMAGLSPVISVLHDASENDYADKKLMCSELILQWRSSGVIAVSPRAASAYTNKFKYPKVKCIPNGIDIESYRRKFSMKRIQILKELGIPQDALLVLQVGRITEIKQQHLSIGAVGGIIQKYPNIHLLLAGILENEESLVRIKTAIDDARCHANIHILGPRQDIPDLLFASDLYLMPSSREAHSVAMIEALVSGIQIVASDIPAFKFAETYDGVKLIVPEDKENFSKAILIAISSVKKFDRDLSEYDIRNTADKYLAFSSEKRM